jgi:pimeloyl-ACP methyl ester carboxylesterase
MSKDDLSKLGPFRVPMFFFHGRYDLYTPFVAARRFAESVQAPIKKFIPFERSAHFVMVEEPGRFLLTLVREILPLTGEAADFAIGADAVR